MIRTCGLWKCCTIFYGLRWLGLRRTDLFDVVLRAGLRWKANKRTAFAPIPTTNRIAKSPTVAPVVNKSSSTRKAWWSSLLSDAPSITCTVCNLWCVFCSAKKVQGLTRAILFFGSSGPIWVWPLKNWILPIIPSSSSQLTWYQMARSHGVFG
jgi:hypothetical protein